jgi:hypothetical protein
MLCLQRSSCGRCCVSESFPFRDEAGQQDVVKEGIVVPGTRSFQWPCGGSKSSCKKCAARSAHNFFHWVFRAWRTGSMRPGRLCSEWEWPGEAFDGCFMWNSGSSFPFSFFLFHFPFLLFLPYVVISRDPARHVRWWTQLA